MSARGQELFRENEQRFNDIVALKRPDRVPVVPVDIHYFADLAKGISHRDAGYNHQQHYDAILEATLRFGWDFAPVNAIVPAQAYQVLDTKQVRWPGGGLPNDVPFQFVENEHLRADEYDDFLANPSRFVLQTILPRIAGNLEGLGELFLPPMNQLGNIDCVPGVLVPALASPAWRKVLETLLELSDHITAWAKVHETWMQQVSNLGHPPAWHVLLTPAFDMVSDYWRTLKGSTLDMYRHPEKLLATVNVVQEGLMSMLPMLVQPGGQTRVFITAHRGADGFMSNEQFEKFYWPSYKELILGLLEVGAMPIPFCEGDYTQRLSYLDELPAGRIAAHFDKMDIYKFKEALGDKMCFWGNIPASVLCTGTPQQVKDSAKELIDCFSDTGALMLDCGLGVPDEARPENLMALREAADEYGVL